jgi:glucokinase
MILAGDVGGTKARLAIYATQDGSFTQQCLDTFASAEYSGLEEVMKVFLQQHQAKVTRVCIGVPSPVVEGKAKPVNLAWELDEKKLSRALGLKAVRLVNDLVATTASLPFLGEKDLVVLHRGQSSGHENMLAVLAPGTGLGVGFLHKKTNQYEPIGSEGGHADFAPNNGIEIALLEYLHAKLGRVSYERVLSGPGLVNIYNFLKDTGRAAEPAQLAKRFEKEDHAAVISLAGQSREFDICVKALDIFSSVLGAQAGNLVLINLATGGVYLGGGIPPKILPKLQEGAVVASYLNKGRLSNLVAKTPLYVIHDDHAALLGAAYLGSML